MSRAAKIREVQEKDLREVTCPECGASWLIGKASAAQLVRLAYLAVPTWFREATPQERKELVKLDDGSNEPKPMRWLKAMDGSASIEAAIAELRYIVRDPRIVDEVTDPEKEITPEQIPTCCLTYLSQDAVADHAGEETEKLKPFPGESASGES